MAKAVGWPSALGDREALRGQLTRRLIRTRPSNAKAAMLSGAEPRN
jgi:hypothetical protein